MLNIGYDNYVNPERVIAIVRANSGPIIKLIQRAEGEGRVVDCTRGRKRRGVVLMDCGTVILSFLDAKVLMKRFIDAKNLGLLEGGSLSDTIATNVKKTIENFLGKTNHRS